MRREPILLLQSQETCCTGTWRRARWFHLLQQLDVNIPLAQVVHQEKQENIQQIFYYKNQLRCVVVSKKGSKGNESGLCVSRFSGKVQT